MIHRTRTLARCAAALSANALIAAAAMFAQTGALAQNAPAVNSASDAKSLLAPTMPANAKEIRDAMKGAKVGETITIRGHVTLAKDAFDAKSASFTLVDEATRTGERPAADKLPETDKGVAADARVTVQVVDASGKVVAGSLADQHGLKAGGEVFVTGKVVSANGKDSLVIAAASMHVSRAPIPAGFFTAAEPEKAKDVSEARKAGTPKVGDEVVLRGRIGGSKQPFVAGRAVFTLMGRGLKACNENPDDKCSVPWDYCCETKADILANSVTVQVVDAKGQALRTDMKGRRGLKELSEIVIVGKVAAADAKSVVVNATSMYVVQ